MTHNNKHMKKTAMRTKALLPAAGAVAAILTLAMTGCVKDKTDSGELITVGDTLPDFTVTLNSGATFSTEDLRGTPSLIMFFDTECADCQTLLPIVNELYLEVGILDGSSGSSSSTSSIDKAVATPTITSEQVRFLLISRGQDETAVAEYWLENGLLVPYSPQSDSSVYNLFATNIVPRIYISSSDLIVRSTFDDNPLPGRADIYSALSAVINE